MSTNVRTDAITRKMAAGRQAYLFPVWIALLAATLARPAAAQDYWNPGQAYIEIATSNLNWLQLSQLLLLDKPDSASSRTRSRISKFDSRYRADAAVTQRVINEYFSSMRSVLNEQTIREAREYLERENFVTTWRTTIRKAGLAGGDDMADALASFILLNWEMANNRMRDDHDNVAYRAVRDQIHSFMASAPAFAKLSNADRQGLAETMMINFVFQLGAMSHAIQSNDKDLERRMGDTAQQRFQKEFGMNLRDLEVTRNGLAARPGSGAAVPGEGRPRSRPRPASPNPEPPATRSAPKNPPSRASNGRVILVMERARGGGGTRYAVQIPYLLGADGQVFSDPDAPTDEFDVEAARRKRGSKWGRWRKSGEMILVTWSDGSADEWDSWVETAPGRQDQRLDASYSYSRGASTTTMGYSYSKHFRFRPDGSFETDRGASAYGGPGGDGPNAGASAYRANAGTYRIDGNSIELRFRDGRTERRLFYFAAKEDGAQDPIAIGIGPLLYYQDRR